MIINNLAGGEVEITDIKRFLGETEYDISDVYFGDKHIFESWRELESPLPITILAAGEDLIDYRIYGASGGVGEEALINLPEPLCGIGTYIDSLDLSTGVLTRRIKKLVLTGEENWVRQNAEHTNCINLYVPISNANSTGMIMSNVVTYSARAGSANDSLTNVGRINSTGTNLLMDMELSKFSTLSAWKTYLQEQYTAGTPVTIWYVLSEPEVSTIPVPPGLTGTIEGYLIQDGTPTPETPIYPTANGVKQADGTYGIPYGYKLPMVVRSRNLFDKDTYLVDGTLAPVITNDCYDNVIHLKANTTYVMSSDVPNLSGMNHLYVYSANYTYPYQIIYNNHPAEVRTGEDGCIYFRYAKRQYYNQLLDGTYWVMLTEGSASPTEYIPYYRDEENIYIGSDPLAEDEYVDFGGQKIYRMVNGTLTPTDPPVPIPALPTIKGETIIDYNSSTTPAVEPEKMYIKYKPQ